MPLRVVLVAPANRSAHAQIQLSGRVISAGQHAIGAEVDGRITGIMVDVGDHVRAGQLLASIEAAPAREALVQAQARLDAARAIAAERTAQADRAAALVKAGAAADAALETANAAAISAIADVRSARAALVGARRDLALTGIRAPATGTIAVRHVERSAVVAAGSRLFDLTADRATTEILVLAPATSANWPQDWQVEAAGQLLPARLLGSGAAVDALGVTQLRLRLERGRLLPGASVRVTASASSAGRQAIPISAVVAGERGQTVVRYVGPGNVVREAPVRVERLDGDVAMAQILLPATARLITAGAAFVQPGQIVRPRATV